MAFDSLRSAASSGGSRGGAPGGAINSFEVDFNADKAKAQLTDYTKEINKAIKSESKLARAARLRGAQGAGFGSGTGVLGRLSAKFRNNRSLSVGAEGLRVGDVRFSRSGIGLSEKTLVGTGPLAFGVVAGQVTGAVLEGIHSTVEKLRTSKATTGEIIVKGAYMGVAKLVSSVADLFGLQAIARGTIGLVSGLNQKETKQVWDEAIRTIWFGEARQIQLEHELKEAKLFTAQSQFNLELTKKLRSRNMKLYPQNPAAQADYLREDIANTGAERRLFERDISGRPVYKIIGVSLNAGQQ